MRQAKFFEGIVIRMLFGYQRVSTVGQNLESQTEQLIEHGVEVKNVYTDKVSGTTAKSEREGLAELFTVLREGDVLVVTRLDRLARSMKELLSLVEELQEKGVSLVSLHEQIDCTTPQGRLVLHLFSSLSEFQRDLIKERQAEGIAIAKAKGKYKGRPRVNSDKLDAAVTLYTSGEHSVREIAEATGVSRATLYRELRRRRVERAM